jgi:hypothetical protein
MSFRELFPHALRMPVVDERELGICSVVRNRADQEAVVASDYRFSPACQISTIVTGVDVEAATSLSV